MGNQPVRPVLLVVASRDFRDEEYLQPREEFEQAGYRVTVASTTRAKVTGSLGETVVPDTLIDEVSAAQFDAVVFVGGYGSTEYFHLEAAHRLAREAVAAGKPVGALCYGPVILANAGVLAGKRATCHPAQAKALKAAGARYSRRLLEQDANIVTAAGPLTARLLGRTMVDMLKGAGA